MEHSGYDGEEVKRRGKAWYAQTVRAQVETEANIGKVVVIDVETGAYLVDDDVLNPVRAALALRQQHPGAMLWGERIGYNAVYALGGAVLCRSAQYC